MNPQETVSTLRTCLENLPDSNTHDRLREALKMAIWWCGLYPWTRQSFPHLQPSEDVYGRDPLSEMLPVWKERQREKLNAIRRRQPATGSLVHGSRTPYQTIRFDPREDD